jgi:adenosyl cobinamide kinase/adenosyl cobinamide phosphate guanylyltransferase
MLSLILGAARSGKSKLAQKIAAAYPRVVYIATAPVDDDAEMVARIANHRANRPAGWQTVEAPLALAAAIEHAAPNADAVLVDCLTLWLSNLYFAGAQDSSVAELERIAAAASGCHVILVSNELGAGTVPEQALTRRFRDAHGLMNQQAAEAADDVILTVAGLPLYLKRHGA